MKKSSIIFIIAVLAILIIPFAAMGVAGSSWTTETTELAEMPSIANEDGLNADYLSGLGDYFEDHFAFRPQLITLNSKLQDTVLKTSSTDQVVLGTDGYMYFSGELGDYQRTNTMSSRELKNIAHNLKLMQDYLELLGSKMIFTIAPNKSSLYPEYMPYNMIAGEGESNAERLVPYLEEYGVCYANLFESFENRQECLYYKEDSHWNTKGAALAFDTIMSRTDKNEWTDYSSDGTELEATHSGDLAEMLWPEAVELEEDYKYNTIADYEHVGEVDDYMDDTIETTCADKTGSLYMFRDSFGESLVQFFSSEYANAYYSRLVPYNLPDTVLHSADTVVIEKVERNLDDFANRGALMEGPVAAISIADEQDSASSIEISKDGSYDVIEGTVDVSLFNDETEIYVQISNAETGEITTYEPFYISYENEDGNISDNGFCLYIFNDGTKTGQTEVSLVINDNNNYTAIKSAVLNYEDKGE